MYIFVYINEQTHLLGYLKHEKIYILHFPMYESLWPTLYIYTFNINMYVFIYR